jgi:hypothetical protein
MGCVGSKRGGADASFVEGPHAIKGLSPSLRELVGKNDGMPAFAPDEERKAIICRVKLTPPYALHNARNEHMMDLRRVRCEETKNLLVFYSYDAETDRSHKVLIFATDVITEVYRKKGVTHTGTVMLGVGRWPTVRQFSMWR